MTRFAIGPANDQDRYLLVWGGEPIDNDFLYAHSGLPKKLDRTHYYFLATHRYKTMYSLVAKVPAKSKAEFIKMILALNTTLDIRPLHEATIYPTRWRDHPSLWAVEQ